MALQIAISGTIMMLKPYSQQILDVHQKYIGDGVHEYKPSYDSEVVLTRGCPSQRGSCNACETRGPPQISVKVSQHALRGQAITDTEHSFVTL